MGHEYEGVELVQQLLDADGAYTAAISSHYDEVLHEVITRVAQSGSVGKLDIAALSTWKRLRADTRWTAELMGRSELEIRECTAHVVAVGKNRSITSSEAAGTARQALSELPGLRTGDALASTICLAAAPDRFAVYDRRAHQALTFLGIDLDNRPGRYRRYMAIVDDLLGELSSAGHDWDARRVDTALYQLGAPR